MSDAPARRSTHQESPLSYVEVGASGASDLMKFPPAGTTPYEERVRIGSGEDRFTQAAAALMTWQAQRGAGLDVTDVVAGSGQRYASPQFSEAGLPTAASGAEDAHYAPDGTPFLTVGTTANVTTPRGRVRHMLIISTHVDERLTGFVWGTCDAEGSVGEQSFRVSWNEDDSVWAQVRGFFGVRGAGPFGVRAKSTSRDIVELAKRQIEALVPGRGVGDAKQSSGR